MNIFNHLEIDLWNGWIFLVAFIFLNAILVLIYPKHFAKRVFTMPTLSNKNERFFSPLNFIFFIGTMSVSIFLPIKFGNFWFVSGMTIFAAGIISYTSAMINFATTPPDQPVTKGIYRISRNPMQVMAMITWIGVGLVTASWLIIILCVLQGFFSFPSMTAQEKFCIKKYGNPYREYMKKAPRYLW